MLETEDDEDDDSSVTETLLESVITESVSEGREGDRPENASSTTSKKEPRTPEINVFLAD